MTDSLSISRSEHIPINPTMILIKSSERTGLRSPHIRVVRSEDISKSGNNSSSDSSSSKNIRKKSRKVTFSTDTQMEYVVLRSEIPKEEFEATWYCRDDFKEMKKQMKPIIKKMAKGLPLDAETEEGRGLEHKTPQGTKRRCQNRFISIDAVLQEQDRQWEYDRIDPEAIAKVYNQAAAHCLMQSYLKAKEDAEFVQREVVQEESLVLREEEKENKEQSQGGETQTKNDVETAPESLPSSSQRILPVASATPQSCSRTIPGLMKARVLSAAAC